MSRIVVVGDALLDRDVTGSVDRVAPDAPVPVVDASRLVERPGGAGLAAVLAAGEGHDVELVAAVGADAAGDRLSLLLADAGVQLHRLPLVGTTPSKTRISAPGHPLLRLDDGDGRAGADGPVPAAVRIALERADAVIVSDYGRGVTAHPGVRHLLAATASRRPVVWDPHPSGAVPVANVALATPNAAEAVRWCPAVEGPAGTLAAATRRAATLVGEWRARAVAVTRGAGGAVLSFGAGSPLVLPAPAVDGADPCGAGDRFAVAAAERFAAGGVASEAVAAAVEAAARFVAAGGARGLADAARGLADESPETSIRDGNAAGGPPGSAYDDALATVQRVRAAGGTVVATGGCFDLLHAGHVTTLEAARGLGDCLVVCINSDASVRRLKGPARPVVGERDRVRVLGALSAVDAVVVFGEDTPERVLGALRPDVWVKGGDYSAQTLPETALVERWGGTVVVVPYLADRSTTRLVQAIGATR